MGEFLTIDPMGNWYHGQGNGYSGLQGDPLNFVDYFGLDNWNVGEPAKKPHVYYPSAFKDYYEMGRKVAPERFWLSKATGKKDWKSNYHKQWSTHAEVSSIKQKGSQWEHYF